MATGNQELSAYEWQQIRGAFTQVMRDKFWITNPYELQAVCAHLGLDPSLTDMEQYVEEHQPSFDFMTLLKFVEGQKRAFFTPDPKNMNTMEAFMAVGGKDVMESGQLDGSATINYAELRDTCHQFNLSLDEGEETSDGETICYDIFAQMFPDEMPVKRPKKLNLGHDYDQLLIEEQKRELARKKSEIMRRKSRKSFANVMRTKSAVGMQMMQSSVIDAQVNTHAQKMAEHPLAPVRQAPVPPQASNTIANDDDDAEGSVERKKRRKAPKRKSRENGLGTTRAWGRSGVYVDDAPKDGSFLPSIPKHAKPPPTAPESPILARIDARVDAMNKRAYTNFRARAAEGRTPTSVAL